MKFVPDIWNLMETVRIEDHFTNIQRCCKKNSEET